MIVLLGDRTKKDEMGGASGTNGTQVLLENLKEDDYFDVVGVVRTE